MYFDRHIAPACDIGGRGTAFTWGGKNFEWAETTGGEEGRVTVTEYRDQFANYVKRERSARGWKVGEKPPHIDRILYVSRFDSKNLISFGK